jgi:hypothetical protein
MTKAHRIVGQLNSWKDGYIAPSASILMGEAAELIQEQMKTIEELDAALEDAREQIKELKKPKTKPKAKA